MIVVADASPFIGLLKIGCVDVLPKLFGRVVVPREVWAELGHAGGAEVVRAFAAAPPDWLDVREATDMADLPPLHAGERAAISLAVSLGADLLLIDERDGRRAATDCGLKTARTAAVLFRAADAGVLDDLAAAYARLKATDFRVPPAVLDGLLARHRATRGDPNASGDPANP